MDTRPVILLSVLIAGPAIGAPHLQAVVDTSRTASNAARITRTHAANPVQSFTRSQLCVGPSTRECSGAISAALQGARRPAAASTPGLEVHRADIERILGTHTAALSDADSSAAALHAGPLAFRDQEPLVRRVQRIGKEGIQFVKMPRGQQGEFTVGISRKGMLGFSLKTSSD